MTESWTLSKLSSWNISGKVLTESLTSMKQRRKSSKKILRSTRKLSSIQASWKWILNKGQKKACSFWDKWKTVQIRKCLGPKACRISSISNGSKIKLWCTFKHLFTGLKVFWLVCISLIQRETIYKMYRLCLLIIVYFASTTWSRQDLLSVAKISKLLGLLFSSSPLTFSNCLVELVSSCIHISTSMKALKL